MLPSCSVHGDDLLFVKIKKPAEESGLLDGGNLFIYNRTCMNNFYWRHPKA